jgi:6-phosphogluconate dehydrogenase (decarboxylating)
VALSHVLSAGDIIIDSGNTNFDDIRRAETLGPGLTYVDVGTSSGVWGSATADDRRRGRRIQSSRAVFNARASQRLPHRLTGSGHYVKMVLRHRVRIDAGAPKLRPDAQERHELDMPAIASRMHGASCSWLLELTAAALAAARN